MTGAEIEYSASKADEEVELIALYHRLLDAGKRTAALYRWRRERAAASGGVRPFVARLGPTIVGAVSAVPVDLTCRGSDIRAVWQQDSIVDPSMRGRGIGGHLLEKATCESDILLAKGTSDAMYRLRLKSGFQDVPNSEYLLCVLSPNYPAAGIVRRLLTLLLFGWTIVRKGVGGRSPLRCSPVDEFGSEFDLLDQRLAAEDVVRPRKTAAFLNWRYCQCPSRSYRILRVADKDRLRGAAVLRLNEERNGDAWLVDLICDLKDSAALSALLKDAIQIATGNGAGCIKTFSTSARIRRHLYSRGFVRTSSTPRFTFRADSPFEFHPDRVEWDFWHGDGDLELY